MFWGEGLDILWGGGGYKCEGPASYVINKERSGAPWSEASEPHSPDPPPRGQHHRFLKSPPADPQSAFPGHMTQDSSCPVLDFIFFLVHSGFAKLHRSDSLDFPSMTILLNTSGKSGFHTGVSPFCPTPESAQENTCFVKPDS